MTTLKLGKKSVGAEHPTYFVADIASNHDGDLERAKLLIRLCAEAGADAAKFQNFRAPKLVSERGFNSLGNQLSHQTKWKKSVFQVYREASLPWEWTPELKRECEACGIEYFSAPYDLEAVDMLDPFVSLFKIGSGDITWPEMLHKVASKKKPVLLATGASEMEEVQRAVEEVLKVNSQLVLMQCNTNYTGSRENFRHIHLRVLETFRAMFPSVVLGLSDHTPGYATVLGAVALGARVIEKHFTDDNQREGPDHPFSMTPSSWREMVDRTRELECALSSPQKFVAENEQETVIVQRRCLRATQDLKAGTVLREDMLEALRPAPREGVVPFDLPRVVGRKLLRDLPQGECLRWNLLAGIEGSE
ncbi:MAG TPA: N-acetylneuraminate synthase family protein [Candidatus Dormibacteraeota bacterium]|jgi:sialic acid synthase SpsE|nr:N-acetylneuraminate synthase family protein [Candidatus Dormibacteraeota bacterium]